MAGEVLTSEQAKEVELPSFVHPIERVREIGRLASEISPTNIVGWFPGSQQAYTRRGLVRVAEAHERATSTMRLLNYIESNPRVVTWPEGEIE